MKEIKKYVFLLLAVLCIMTACETDSYKEEGNHAKLVSTNVVPEIVNNLRIFNDSLIQISGSCNISNEKIKGENEGKLWATVSADILAVPTSFKICAWVARHIVAFTGGTMGTVAIIGVLGGTAFLAGGASYGTYKGLHGGCTYSTTMDEYLRDLQNNQELYAKLKTFKEISSPLVLLDEDTIPVLDTTICANVAQLHNDIISCLEYSESSEEEEETIMKAQTEFIDDEEKDECVNSYGLDIYGDDDIVCMTNNVSLDMSTYGETADYQSIIRAFKNDGKISGNTEEILNLLFSILQQNIDSKENICLIISNYKEEIASSTDLTVDERNILILCLEMAMYSYDYWYSQGVR